MPPVLGWAAVTGATPGEAWLLFLIIFVWTPPHFWSLALYRTKEYAAAGIPMLPVTHGAEYTRRHVFLYTVGLSVHRWTELGYLSAIRHRHGKLVLPH